jgi:hypothetical protein
MQAVPAGAGGQQVQVRNFFQLLNELRNKRLIGMNQFHPVLIMKTCAQITF